MRGSEVPAAQRELIASLAAMLRQQTGQCELFETHISWVFVCGQFAYKFKKAVCFDFVDYSTLAARRFYCGEELRLNRRLAPQLYLDVVKITGSMDHPVIDGPGEALEFCVRMHAFPQQALWDYRIDNQLVTSQEAEALAMMIAQFHQAAGTAPEQTDWGSVSALEQVARGNLRVIADLLHDPGSANVLSGLTDWVSFQLQKLRCVFAERKMLGFVRECHGDLHLRNILTLDGQVGVFDCIEFNDSLRWIDVMNDIAFLCMDLHFHGRRELAARILNRYLAVTGDYEGIAVLRYYQVQRALTRCKVGLLKARQSDSGEAAHAQEGMRYLRLAAGSTSPAPPALMITHGYSGSGKSYFSSRLLELTGAIHLRSDLERKRIAGIAPAARSGADIGLYTANATRLTYQRLHELAARLLESGWPVIVDATFLKKEQRRLFQGLAASFGARLVIFDVQASLTAVKSRIASRHKDGRDPSDADLDVLARQLADDEPLTADEGGQVIAINLDREPDENQFRRICEPVLNPPGS